MKLSELLKSTRQYFWDLGFEEVEVPYLNSSLPLEPNIYTFSTINTHSGEKFYLPASPEFALKKFLSEHHRNCFAISHCFRDLESAGPHHHPEFLMLEYYLVNKNLTELKQSLEKYISRFLKIEFTELHLPNTLPDNEPDFNQWFLNEFEPTIPHDKAVFVTGYPAFLSPLAKVDKQHAMDSSSGDKFGEVGSRAETSNVGDHIGREARLSYKHKNLSTSSRFELYINGVEIANGCEENRNSEQILRSFDVQHSYRLQNNLPTHPPSRQFAADSSLLPPCCGVGVGIDRLLMVINRTDSL